MKNYPHLYNHLNKKASSKISKSPIKSINNNPLLNTKTSSKTIVIYNNHMNSEKKNVTRVLTKSIQDFRHNYQTQAEEQAVCPIIGSNLQDQELFSRSYSKIGKIKQAFPYKSIDNELNEILNLIKEQKNKINLKMKALKTTNDQYKKICQSYFKNQVDAAINTDDILDSMNEKVCLDKMVECNLIQEVKAQGNELSSDTAPQSNSILNKEAYLKLTKMLQQMNINAQDVLPCQQKIHEEIYISDYKSLSDRQVIKIQKFFIKKLIQKMPK